MPLALAAAIVTIYIIRKKQLLSKHKIKRQKDTDQLRLTASDELDEMSDLKSQSSATNFSEDGVDAASASLEDNRREEETQRKTNKSEESEEKVDLAKELENEAALTPDNPSPSSK